MKAPSKRTIEQNFPGCDADKVRAIIKGTLPPESVPAVAQWVAQCYHRPSIVELKMNALNALLDGHGVEAIYNRAGVRVASYVNMGDTYNATILHAQSYRITTIGDFVESYERRYGRLP